MSETQRTSSVWIRPVTASLSRGGAHHGARSPSTSATVSAFSTSQPYSSSRARSTSPWWRSSSRASVSSPPSSGAIGSSRNRGVNASRTSDSMWSSRTLDSAIAVTSATSSTTRWALAGWASQAPNRRETPAAPMRSRMIASCRKFSPTNSSSPRPSSSFLRGISAVCGTGSPSGCLNRAVTANQSAIAPTIDASAPALTKPRNPPRSRVTTYTTAASTSSPVATVRIRRSPARRIASAAGSPATRGPRGAVAVAVSSICRRFSRTPGGWENPAMPRTVLTFGPFDVFHGGHLRVIERAAQYGDRLVVGVSSDALNVAKKGREPVFSQAERLAIVGALKPVDEVFVEESLELKRHYIEQFAADVLVMGDDWKDRFDEFMDVCEVVYLPRTPAISTTALIEKISDLA